MSGGTVNNQTADMEIYVKRDLIKTNDGLIKTITF